jgi:hypothetical protein
VYDVPNCREEIMPLVFVQGVATRTSEAYLKEEKERSRL